jgi:hypothetical protein
MFDYRRDSEIEFTLQQELKMRQELTTAMRLPRNGVRMLWV